MFAISIPKMVLLYRTLAGAQIGGSGIEVRDLPKLAALEGVFHAIYSSSTSWVIHFEAPTHKSKDLGLLRSERKQNDGLLLPN